MKLTPLLLCLLLPAVSAAAAGNDDASIRTACTELATKIRAVDSVDSCVKQAAARDAHTEALIGIYFMSHNDLAAAILWYKRAADQGDAIAEDGLGYLYQSGHGVKKNQKIANAYFRKSAQQGFPDGQFYLGENLILAKHYKEGAYWTEKAARKGSADAQFNLAVLYRDGHGVPKDSGYMYFWFKVSAENGNPKSQEVISRMDPMLPAKVRAEVDRFIKAQLKRCPDCINAK